MKKMLFFSFPVLLFIACQTQKKEVVEVDPVVSKLDTILHRHMLDLWYPRVIDTVNGGYFTNYDYQWDKKERQEKYIVTQTRHVWSLAFVNKHFPERNEYLDYAQHGVKFLKDKMWDEEYGGFFELLDSKGNLPDVDNAYQKRAYGNSFAIYGLSEYYKQSKDTAALELAKKTFRWLDEHARDTIYGGYFNTLNRDGSPILRKEAFDSEEYDRMLFGLKEFNSTIHILEAFTNLYQVWKDSLLQERLEEMYHIVSDTMYDDRGFLKLYFHPDWTLASDDDQNAIGENNYYMNHVTFGHDVETAFLLYEAALVLDKDIEALKPKMKQMLDHALAHGWDEKVGGFYDMGKYSEGQMEIISHEKSWWGQAEGLNTLLLMSEFYPDDTLDYYAKFEKQLKYIEQYLLDDQYGGWYVSGIDENDSARKADKAQMWKGNYHTIRAVVSCLERMGAIERSRVKNATVTKHEVKASHIRAKSPH